MKRLLTLCLCLSSCAIFAHEKQPFSASSTNIPKHVAKKMEQYTWHPGCPVPLSDLRYIRMTYWGFDEKTHKGALIVNKSLVKEVISIFKSLYEHQFPIAHMDLMDKYHGDDLASMSANNTSAFNCRALTKFPGLMSQHSYGRAIDINPRINPYTNGTTILPANGAKYIDRHKAFRGIIAKDSLVYTIFTEHGWDWAGNWYDVHDYQHFEKRAQGVKRNPYGANAPELKPRKMCKHCS